MQRSLIHSITIWLFVTLISLSTLNLITPTNGAVMSRNYYFLSSNNDVLFLGPSSLSSSSQPAAALKLHSNSNMFARRTRSDNDDSEKHEKPRPLRFGKRTFRVRMTRSSSSNRRT